MKNQRGTGIHQTLTVSDYPKPCAFCPEHGSGSIKFEDDKYYCCPECKKYYNDLMRLSVFKLGNKFDRFMLKLWLRWLVDAHSGKSGWSAFRMLRELLEHGTAYDRVQSFAKTVIGTELPVSKELTQKRIEEEHTRARIWNRMCDWYGETDSEHDNMLDAI